MFKSWITRAVTIALLVFTFVATFCGCSSNSSNANSSSANAQFTESGYLIGPAGESCTVNDPYRSFTYTILNDNEYDVSEFNKKTNETLEIVKNWWMDDSTFVEPKGIIPVKFSIPLRGFAEAGYIFIDPDAEDSMDTVCHETIHLQNEEGLRDESDNGYTINEMLVEDITKRIMAEKFMGLTTEDQRFFINCPELVKHREWLEQSFKEKKTAKEIYSPIFGEKWVYVTQTLNYWDSLPGTLNATELEAFCNSYLGLTSSQLLQLYNDLGILSN